MSTAIQRRRGTTAQHATFTGLAGETTVDTDKNTVVVHNGSTAGGFPLLKENFSNAPDGVVTTAKLADGVLSADVAGRAKMADNFVTTAKLADGSVTTAKWASSNGQLAGMRNKIINGKMDIAQRGTSFAAIASGVPTYTLDRFFWYYQNTTAVVTVSQQSDVPSSNEFQSSLRVAVTTADASTASNETAVVTQNIEGYNVRDLIGRTFTISFWVRSSKTGTHCLALKNSGSDRTYVAEYTINAANTWEQKTVTVGGGLITAGTWNWTNGVGLTVSWVMACGTAQQTTAGAWQTGNFLATANQVNCLDSNTNIFAITGVQLEVGSVATPFEHRPFGAELALCQRYCESSYPTGVAFGSITNNDLGIQFGTHSATGNGNGYPVRFSVAKRAAPTVTLYSPATGATGARRAISGGGTDVASSASGITISGFSGANGTWNSAEIYAFHYVAISEL